MSAAAVASGTDHQIIADAYSRFIDALPSVYSQYTYKNNLKLYMQYRNILDYDSLIKESPATIQTRIIDYILFLRKQGILTGRSINTRINSILKFYEY
jgi:hypothetical protein